MILIWRLTGNNSLSKTDTFIQNFFPNYNRGSTEVSPKFTEPDSDLSNVGKAVNLLKNKANHILTTTSSCNIKCPCGICKISVNKNKKAINSSEFVQNGFI